MSELNNLGKSNKILLILLAVALAGGCFLWGLVYSKINAAPEILIRTVTKDVSRYVEKPTIERVETVVEKKVVQEVPVVEYVEVEKEAPAALEQFASVEELTAWLDADRTDELPYIVDIFECENFAQTLIKHAMADGRYLSFQVLKDYTRPDTGKLIEGPHAINNAIIGNYIYFIDPQTDDFWAAYVLEK